MGEIRRHWEPPILCRLHYTAIESHCQQKRCALPDFTSVRWLMDRFHRCSTTSLRQAYISSCSIVAACPSQKITGSAIYLFLIRARLEALSSRGGRKKKGASRLRRDAPWIPSLCPVRLLHQDHVLHVLEFTPGRKRSRLQAVEVYSGGERKSSVVCGVPLHGLVPGSDRPIDEPRDFLAENVVDAQPDVARLGQIVRDLRRRVEWIRIVRMKREPGGNRHGQSFLVALDS